MFIEFAFGGLIFLFFSAFFLLAFGMAFGGTYGAETIAALINEGFKEVPFYVNPIEFQISRLYGFRGEEQGGVQWLEADGPEIDIIEKGAPGGTAFGLSEGSTFSFSTRRTYIKPKESLARAIGRAEITHEELEALKTEAAVMGKVEELLNDIQTWMKFYARVSFFTYHSTYGKGYIGQYTVGASNETIPALGNTPASFTLTGDGTVSELKPGAWWFTRNLIVDIYDTSGNKQGTAIVHSVSKSDRKTVKLTSIDSNPITLTASTTYVFYLANAKDAAPIGFEFIADTAGTLHNINRSTYDEWKGIVNSDAGGTSGLTIDILEKVFDAIGNDLSTKPKELEVYTTNKQLRQLRSDLEGKGVNYNVNLVREREEKLKYGDWGIEIDGTPVYYDPYVPAGRAYVVSLDTLQIRYLSLIQPLPKIPGSGPLYRVDKSDTYAAEFYMSIQQICTWPAHNAKIVQLANDVF